jgi:hypothetical protein
VDRSKIIDALGLVPGGTIIISDVTLRQWGREIIFECDYQTTQPDDSLDPMISFRLIYRDCREMKWRSYAHIAMAEMGEIAPSTEIVDLLFGLGNHRRDANLLATHFALTVSYGEIWVDYKDELYQIA